MKRLAVLAVVAGVVWLGLVLLGKDADDVDAPTTAETEASAAVPWLTASVGAVDRVVVEGPGGSYVLYKEQGEWLIRTPAQGAGGAEIPADLRAGLRADRSLAEALLTFVRSNPPRRVFTGIGDQTDGAAPVDPYGLDNATARLMITADGETFGLALGDSNPAGDGVYAALLPGPKAPEAMDASGDDRMTGDPVVPDEAPAAAPEVLLLLDSGYTEQLSHAASRYFDLRLVDFSREALAVVAYRGLQEAASVPGSDLAETLDESSQAALAETTRWAIAFNGTVPRFDPGSVGTPDADSKESRASANRADDATLDVEEAEMYAERVITMRGVRIHEPQPDERVEPLAALDLWRVGAAAPERIRLTVRRAPHSEDHGGGHTPGEAGDESVYVAESAWRKRPVTLRAEDVRALMRTRFSLQDRRVLAAPVEAIATLRVEAGGKTFAAMKEDERWQVTDQPANATVPGGVATVVWALADLRRTAPAVALEESATAGEPLLRTTVGGEDFDEVALVWREVDGELFVARLGANPASPASEASWSPVGAQGRALYDILATLVAQEAAQP